MLFVLMYIVGPLIGYLFIAGVLRRPFAKVSIRRCPDCINGKHPKKKTPEYGRAYTVEHDSLVYHGEMGSIQAGFWPVTLPWTAGSMIGDSDRAQRKEEKAAARRKYELDEARHQAELAKIRADEDAHLTRQLQDK